MDDAYLGGKRRGGKRGRGAGAKTPIVVAVETGMDGHPLRLKRAVVKGFRKAEIRKLGARALVPGSRVISDGLSCFTAVTRAGCRHQPIITGSGARAVQIPAFEWVNTTIDNIKNAIRGTYHAIRPRHVPRYLAQFGYRYNRRYQLENMIPRLARAAINAPPMPYRLLKLAEFGAQSGIFMPPDRRWCGRTDSFADTIAETNHASTRRDVDRCRDDQTGHHGRRNCRAATGTPDQRRAGDGQRPGRRHGQRGRSVASQGTRYRTPSRRLVVDLSGTEDVARDYVKSHGLFARDIMSCPAITVEEDAVLGDIANILESRRIKRVPVMHDGKLVGIVTRADLLRGLATRNLARGVAAPAAAVQPASQAADRAIREQLLATMKQAEWTSATHVNVIVTDGVVHLWGLVYSKAERRALHVASENVDGATGVEDHLGSLKGVAGFA